ncbi:MAG TPA: DNA polymerase III subunit alpha, partial [Acidobacteriaceae bacterium]|nr:DNA polymerase III subunit alpha [Acidobacteriaceae bacterium]
ESLKIEVPVLVKGSLRADDDESAPKLSVSSIQPLEDIKIKLPQNVRIRISLEKASEAMLGSLKEIITGAPGPGRLMINLERRGEYCVMLEPEGFSVAADRGFIERAEELLGRGAVQAFE